jgi:hypothetical protein
VADPVPEPEPTIRPVLSTDLEQPPGPRQFQQPHEHRPIWRLESNQVVMVLMLVVVLIMVVMLGVLVASFIHAAHSSTKG